MTAGKCQRCGQFWSFTVDPAMFKWITKVCPTCLPVVARAMDRMK